MPTPRCDCAPRTGKANRAFLLSWRSSSFLSAMNPNPIEGGNSSPLTALSLLSVPKMSANLFWRRCHRPVCCLTISFVRSNYGIKRFSISLSAIWAIVSLTSFTGFSMLMGLVMSTEKALHLSKIAMKTWLFYHSNTFLMHYHPE